MFLPYPCHMHVIYALNCSHNLLHLISHLDAKNKSSLQFTPLVWLQVAYRTRSHIWKR